MKLYLVVGKPIDDYGYDLYEYDVIGVYLSRDKAEDFVSLEEDNYSWLSIKSVNINLSIKEEDCS